MSKFRKSLSSALAVTGMVAAGAVPAVAGSNPCAPKTNSCAGKNPCNPCLGKNPCAGKSPCSAKAKNPCAGR